MTEVEGRNFTDFELDAQLQTAVYIKGFVVFSPGYSCPVELRREAGRSVFFNCSFFNYLINFDFVKYSMHFVFFSLFN